MNKINRFFWWCGGAIPRILEDREMDIEHPRFFATGATILFTGLMAAFAGGYALYIAFDNIIASVFFGIFWGLLIFNLDRSMVITLGKGDGKSSISGRELLHASPRLIMAVLIGVLIAVPLELKLFEDEILFEIENMKSEELAEKIKSDSIDIAYINETQNRIDTIEIKINKLRSSRTTFVNSKTDFIQNYVHELEQDLSLNQKNWQNWQNAVNSRYAKWEKAREDTNYRFSSEDLSKLERSYRSAVFQRNKYGSEIERLKKSIEENKNNQITTTKEEHKNIDEEITMLNNEKEYLTNKLHEREDLVSKNNEEYKLEAENYKGLLYQLKALKNITHESWNLLLAKILIMFMFITIETAPLILKLMQEAGPYDWKLETERAIQKRKTMEKRYNES